MSIFLIAILILFGILLIVLEVLIVPGMVVGFLGLVFILLGIGGAWNEYGALGGILTAIISLALGAFAVWSALRTGFWKHFSLRNRLEGRANEIETGTVHAGDRGYAMSSLRPMGTVKVNGHRFEARVESGLVPPNYPVEVLAVEGSRLLVRPVS
jgi:membrane-bound ClpP family serine protease